MAYDVLNQPVISSTLIFQKDFDSFFSPTTMGHNGFAFDGNLYSAGVLVPGTTASWASELAGPFRGATPSFPNSALVLLNRASLAILETSGNSLIPWMVFLFLDKGAFTDNFNDQTVGYSPSAVYWANGVITVNYAPDPGATSAAPIAVSFNFVRDSVYLDTFAA